MATGQRPNEGRFTRRRSPANVTASRPTQRFGPLVQSSALATDYGSQAQNANLIAQTAWWGSTTVSVVPIVASSTSLNFAFVTTSTTIAKPSGVATGDRLVVAVNTFDIGVATVTGFTLIDRSTSNGADDQELSLFERIADGTEGATFTIAVSSGTNVSALCLRVTGSSASAYDSYGETDSGGSYVDTGTMAGVTAAVDDSLQLSFIATRLSVASGPAGHTSVASATNGGNTVLVAYTKTVAAGATGTTAFSPSASFDLYATGSLAYQPASITGTIAATLADVTSTITGASSTAADDFTFTAADGSSWGTGWTFTQGTGDILTNRGRMVTGTGGFAGVSARYDTGLADISLRIDVEIPTNDAQFPELRLRFDSVNFDYLRLLFEPHNDVVYLHSYDNDVQQSMLDSASFAIAGGDIVHIRADMVGTDIKVRLWLNGAGEPTTWQLEATSSFGQTNDQLMVRTVTSNLGVAITNYWDNLAFVPAVSGTTGQTLVDLTSTITATETISGTIAQTLADLTSSATGAITISGTTAQTLADLTSAFAGTVVVNPTGTIAVSLDDLTSSATGTLTITGTSAVTLADLTSAAAGAVTIDGTVAVTLDTLTGDLSGTITAPTTGTIAVTLADLSGDLTGVVAPPVDGTIAVELELVASGISAQRTGYETIERLGAIVTHGQRRNRKYYNPRRNPVTDH